MVEHSIQEELMAVRVEVSTAADAILYATEAGLAQMPAVRAGDEGAIAELERTLLAILTACSFQDLSGQRLDKIEAWLNGTVDQRADAALMGGPSMHGEGLDQDAADALFADVSPVAQPTR